MKVLGITGFAGSGKSTVATYLVERHGFTRLSFAAPLKKMLRTLNPVIGNPPAFAGWDTYEPYFYLNDLFDLVERTLRADGLPIERAENEIKESSWGPEYRRLLQVLGTDCLRAVDQDFWVKAAVAQMTDPEGKYVFDDVRFPNEAEVIKGFNRVGLWNVVRPSFEAANGHASEQHAGQMGEKMHAINDLSVSELHVQIDHMVAFFLTNNEVSA